ncbi:sigma-54 interaction domain-containing protein [Bacillus alveayuensis]|uniref:sigma-54 interaction domain-containing protein n=1 Tax=Aeribacillus alveayuensis TaxID=279215 RepID=UPI0005CD7648|nr:sigma-54-dependent Fis family transcriptional regulator [Bacillus alveayuensis]
MKLEKHHYKAILESLEDPVIVVLKDSTIVYINEAYSRQFNVPSEKIIGRKLKEIEENARILKVLETGEALINDCSYVHSLKRDVYANITPLKHNGKLIGAVTIMKNLNEITKLQNELERYKRYSMQLEGQLNQDHFSLLESQVPQMISAVNIARKVAGTDVTVILYGESGVGKEVFAKAIHEASTRKDKPFIPINMASIPDNLLESELFGYEEGSFTGSRKGGKKGLLELANGGTLFLDEVGEMSMKVQAKLLRVIQERVFHRVGGTKPYSLDVRIICATNRNLKELIKKGAFREDLYYRLNVVPIHIPPLRERKQDIPYIISNLLNNLILKYKKPVTMPDEIYDILRNYDWPGNIRELSNVLERMLAVCNRPKFEKSDIPEYIQHVSDSWTANVYTKSSKKDHMSLNDVLEQIEKTKLLEVMANSRNRTEAIKKLGISRKSFYAKLKKYGIK